MDNSDQCFSIRFLLHAYDMDKRLHKTYYDPSGPGGYGGINKLRTALAHSEGAVPPLKYIKKWLLKQDPYTLHVPAPIHFRRNRVLVSGVDRQFQADLVDMAEYASENDGVHFLLTCIDVFSKHAWVRPLPSKRAIDVAKAFDDILGEGRTPDKLQTDAGKEFYNKIFQRLMERYNVKHFSTSNETKASIVERFNRTLKTRMWRYLTAANSKRYVDKLQDMVHAYNHSYHRSIKMTPVSVDKDNEKTVFNTLYKTTQEPMVVFRYDVGDTVRISKVRATFRKGYEQTFTDEYFVISQRIARCPPVYKLQDYAGAPVHGTFYEKELQKVIVSKNKVYKIEKIIDRKREGSKNLLYVKWLGWPEAFNSWIAEKTLVDA